MHNSATSTTCGAQPSQSQTRTRRYLKPREITADPAFQFRHTGTDKAHVRGLAKLLRSVGDLDPVLVWQESDAEGQPTGRLFLLDGHHRVAAYATANGHRAAVPSVVVQGSLTEAMLAAVKANSRESLPLTKNERMDAAWRLVRLPGRRVTVPTVAQTAGVGAATVDRMRKRWVVMQTTDKQASGHWWRDRQDGLPEMKERHEMSSTERNAVIGRVSEELRKAFDKMPWIDQDIAADALERAIGTRKLRSMVEYLFNSDEFTDEDKGAVTVPVQESERTTECRDF